MARRSITIARLAFALVSMASAACVLMPSAANAQSILPIGDRQHGTSAALSVHDDAAIVSWRLLEPGAAPHVSASLNGRPLDAGTAEPYPQGDAQTLILFLLDVTDPRRAAQIRPHELRLFQIAGRRKAHHEIAVAVYADKPELLVPADGKIGTLVNMLATAPPRAAAADLDRALGDAIGILATANASRRAIFVLSDTHSDGPLDAEALAARATRGGVAITFILEPSERPAEVRALQAIARASGGQVVTGAAAYDAFLSAPFALLDSGATVRFPIKTARRLIWEREARVEVRLEWPDGHFELMSSAPVALAGVAETGAYLWESHKIAIGIPAAMLALLTALVVARRRRRSAALPADRAGIMGSLRTRRSEDGSQARWPSSLLQSPRRPAFDALWEDLKAQLRHVGMLPPQPDRLTPEEIARHVLATSGDTRAQRFVQGYYYPRRYGKEAGSLTDTEADAIVSSFGSTERHQTTPAGLDEVSGEARSGASPEDAPSEVPAQGTRHAPAGARGIDSSAGEGRTHAVSRLVEDLLAVSDNIGRALQAGGTGKRRSDDPAAKTLLDGIELTERELLRVLAKHGVKRLDPLGSPFDPRLHESMSEVLDTSVPEGTVVEVARPGYTLDGRVLRPALVAISKGGPTPLAQPGVPAAKE